VQEKIRRVRDGKDAGNFATARFGESKFEETRTNATPMIFRCDGEVPKWR